MLRLRPAFRLYRKNLRNNRPAQAGLGLVLVLLGFRATPHLIPIQAEDLPQTRPAIAFRDRHNRPLGTLLSPEQEHTATVSLSQVSPNFIQAILAAEDQRFYHHGPVDLRAAARATWQGLRDRRVVSGASTVTMQLARMVTLQDDVDAPIPRTFPGKAQQIWQSWRLAAGMSKDEILTAYVNRLPMGSNIYGVEAAARVYFGVSAVDLTVAQASLLAALPNAPTALNPYTGWEALKERQRYVLDRMVVAGELSEGERDRIFAEAVTFKLPEPSYLAAPHFQFWLTQNLPNEHPSQLRTSLDLSLQQFVETQVQQMVKGLAKKSVRHGAAIVVENATGEVLAYVGSPSYFSAPRLLGSGDRRNSAGSNDGVQALRQPGSTLKPFLYQLALEEGVIKPNSILQDVPTHYAIPGAKLYSPVDYSETFLGPVRVRAALGNSLNIPAVRVLEEVGVEKFLARLRSLGFTHLTESAEHYGLGLSLGSGEVSLWELAQAYLTLARGNKPDIPLTGFATVGTNRVRPASTDALAMADERANRGHVASADALTMVDERRFVPTGGDDSFEALVTDILSDPHARATAFGVESVLNLPFPAAVKTGTSSDFRDTWTVGFTQDYTVATWVGNFDGSPMHQVSGVTGAAPLWHRIMVHLHEDQEPGRFAPPAGMEKRPICATTGQKPTPDCEAVVQEYFLREDLAAYDNSDADAIASTSPSPKAAIEAAIAPATETDAIATSLHITSPTPNSRFLLFPSVTPGNDQRLEFAVSSGSQNTPVQWTLNGQVLNSSATQSADTQSADTQSGSQRSFFWPMQPGQWTLEAKQGQQTAQIQFEVEFADPQATRKGFSVTNSSQSP